MNTEQAAIEHAGRINWDVDEAVTYVVALLTEVNAHRYAAAVQALYDADVSGIEAFNAELIRQQAEVTETQPALLDLTTVGLPLFNI